jgi:hypothetical protein
MLKEVSFSLEFIDPADEVLDAARKMGDSSNQEERAVGNALLELTDITRKTQTAINDASEDSYDFFAVYLGYKFGDSLETAKRLSSSPDPSVRNAARTLLSQADAVAASKVTVKRIVPE